MANLIEDVSVLTDVSQNSLYKLCEVTEYCISHAVHEGICKNESSVSIDMEFGRLDIYIQKHEVKYRFVPSKELESKINKTIISKESPIALKLCSNLREKIDKSYKEYLK